MNSVNPDSKEALQSLLSARGVDTASWGTGTAKAVDDLWAEIEQGEATLQGDPFRRVVSVVEVLIVQDGRYLLEAEQEFHDGRRRTRDTLPAEKLGVDERPKEGARRCLMEELALERADIHELWRRAKYQTTLTESPSYPGLRTEYDITRVAARVRPLPNTAFWTDESEEAGKEPVRRHRWAWKPLSDPG